MPTAATTTASSDQNRLNLPTRLHDEAEYIVAAVLWQSCCCGLSSQPCCSLLCAGPSGFSLRGPILHDRLMKAIAVSSDQRMPRLPNVPTGREMGFEF